MICCLCERILRLTFRKCCKATVVTLRKAVEYLVCDLRMHEAVSARNASKRERVFARAPRYAFDTTKFITDIWGQFFSGVRNFSIKLNRNLKEFNCFSVKFCIKGQMSEIKSRHWKGVHVTCRSARCQVINFFLTDERKTSSCIHTSKVELEKLDKLLWWEFEDLINLQWFRASQLNCQIGNLVMKT